MLATAVGLHRVRDDDPTRGPHLARAASSGLAAVPALWATSAALGPGPGVLFALQLAVVALALWWAARSPAGSGGPTAPAVAVWLVAGAVWTLAAAIAAAALAGSGPVSSPGRAAAIFDLDARIATRPLPRCPGPATVAVLADRGARPRLGLEGRRLWFDADTGGVRQIHSLALATGRSDCHTCAESGHNRRPYPTAAGVVFETDRHASAARPANTELHFLRGETRSDVRSRRLTRSPGPDDHPIFAHASGQVVWSRRREGGFEIVSAALQSAHGGLALGAGSVWVRGGTDWIAPLEWSRDGRALAIARGNPFAPRRVRVLDFGTDATIELGAPAAPGGVAFRPDRGAEAVAVTRRGSVLGLLPSSLVTPFAFAATRSEAWPARFGGTELQVGQPAARLALPLPLEAWGAPTGLAVSDDGTVLYLGQQRADGAERLVRIDRGCD
jgi:hypothetical protein